MPGIAVSSSIPSGASGATPTSPTSGAASTTSRRCARRSAPTSRSWSTAMAVSASAPPVRSRTSLPRTASYWFEEPVDPENYMALGQVARPPGLLIATGERCYSRYQVPQLLARRPAACPPARPDPGRWSARGEEDRGAGRQRLSAGVVPLPVRTDCDGRGPAAQRGDDQHRHSRNPFPNSMPPGAASSSRTVQCRWTVRYAVSSLPGPGRHRTQRGGRSRPSRTRRGRSNRCGRSTAPWGQATRFFSRRTVARTAYRTTQALERMERNVPPL